MRRKPTRVRVQWTALGADGPRRTTTGIDKMIRITCPICKHYLGDIAPGVAASLGCKRCGYSTELTPPKKKQQPVDGLASTHVE